MVRKLQILLILTLIGFSVLADDVRFTMDAPKVVSVNEQFRLSLSLNKNGSDLKLPNLSNFDVLMGPSTSQSTSIQMINGKTTQTVNFSYTFILRAKQEGTYSISPASIRVESKVYESNSINIQVVKGQSPTQTNQIQNKQNTQSSASSNDYISKENMFVRVELDKKNVYKGEQIIATVKLYLSPSVPLSGFDDVKLPTYEGFWTKDIDIPNQVNFTREVFNGKIYQVGVLKKTILFPQQIGTIEIEPFEITCLVRQRIRQQRSFFDDFFDNYRNVKAKIISDQVNINVKELPNPPANFYGAVGNFRFSANLDKTSLKTNEAATLKISVSGNGNLKLIEAPQIDLPKDFEIYDPKTTDKMTAGENGLNGTVTFDYLFIPRYAGDYTIPVIPFSFFNPSTRQYVTRTAGPFTMHIEKGDEEQGTTVVSSYSKEDVRFIGKDIRYIKQEYTKLRKKGRTFYGTFGFYLTYLITSILFLIIFTVYRKKVKENANVALVRNKKANKVARKRLKEAASFLKQNKAEEFYESITKAFWGYLSDKLGIAISEMNRETASEKLIGRKVEQDVVTEFLQIIDDCEFARYAPSAYSGTMKDVYDSSARIIGKFEKQIK